jgi:hypothetical protein
MSSVAFWYQIEPHKPWPAMPPGPDRLPYHDRDLVVGYKTVGTAKHSDDPVEVQSLGGVTDGKQFWFRPTTTNAWVEIPFVSETNQSGDLMVRMVHSWDYGIYRVLLDGHAVGQLDLYDANVNPTTDKLSRQTLSAGPHTLRFECTGKASKSAGYYLGFDALAARVPVYSRPKSVDLRTLQKKN